MQNFNQEIGHLRKYQIEVTELKNAITELKNVPMLLKFPVIRESVTSYIFLLGEILQFVNILSFSPDFTFWLLFDVRETAQINATTFLKHQM